MASFMPLRGQHAAVILAQDELSLLAETRHRPDRDRGQGQQRQREWKLSQQQFSAQASWHAPFVIERDDVQIDTFALLDKTVHDRTAKQSPPEVAPRAADHDVAHAMRARKINHRRDRVRD